MRSLMGRGWEEDGVGEGKLQQAFDIDLFLNHVAIKLQGPVVQTNDVVS